MIFAGVIILSSLFALPASADVTSVSGGAFGASVTSSLLGPVLAPTPSVTLPPGGGGPFTQSALPIDIPGVLGVGVLNASTQGGNLGTHQGFAQSSADVANVTVGGAPPIVPPNLTIQAVHSECLSNGDGSSGLTRLVGVFGANIPELPAPNSSVPTAQLPPGIAEIRLNEQIVQNAPGSTSIIVNAVRITLLPNPITGAVLEIILAQSRCAAVGPDVNTGQVAVIKDAPADAQDVTFTFTITCPGVAGSPFTRTVTGDGTTDPVINVPAGTQCTATEAPVAGFVEQASRSFPAVASGSTSTVTFVNTRIGTPGTGSVAVIKDAPADAQDVVFTFTITCPGVVGSPFTRTVTGDGTTTAVTGIPAGTVCGVAETPVAGFVNQPNQNLPAVVANATQTVTFVNQRAGGNTGAVAVVKQAPTDAQAVVFTFTITCPGVTGSPFTRTVTGSGTTSAIGNLPAGTVCTAAETPVAGFVNRPDQTLPAVTAGTTQTVTFVNARTTAPLPTITVQKSVNPSSRPQPGGAFTFTVRITNTGNAPVVITEITDSVHGNLNNVGTCDTGATLAASPGPGNTYTCIFSVEITGQSGDTETDRVTVTATDAAGRTVTAVSNSVTVSITAPGTPIGGPTVIVNNNNSASCTSNATSAAGGYRIAQVNVDNNNTANCSSTATTTTTTTTTTPTHTTTPTGKVLARTGASALPLGALALALIMAGWAILVKPKTT